MKARYSFEHNGISYLTKNRILSIVNDVVTFEIESGGLTYECLIDLIDIEVLKNRVGLDCGYARIAILGERLHNVIAKRMGLEVQGRVITIDHENIVKLDNRRCNLRIADQSLQNFNQSKKKLIKGKKPSSQFFGVSVFGNSQIMGGIRHNSKSIWQYFSTELEAAQWVTQKMKEIDSERFAKKIAHNEKLLA